MTLHDKISSNCPIYLKNYYWDPSSSKQFIPVLTYLVKQWVVQVSCSICAANMYPRVVETGGAVGR